MQTLARRLALLALSAAPALAQPATPTPPPLVERRNPQAWTVHAELFLTPYQDRGLGGIRYNSRSRINEGAVVFPVLQSTATSDTVLRGLASELQVSGRAVDDEPVILVNYQAGERMARWDLPATNLGDIRLIMDVPMVLYEVRTDTARAAQIPWPTAPLAPVAASALQPQMFIESESPAVRALVAQWTRGNPRALLPFQLARFLTARVQDHVQVTGQGVATGRNFRFSGMQVNGADFTARTGRGTPYDLAALLCAVYRAAGIPARVVIGYDIPASLGNLSGIVPVADNCGGQERREPSNVPVLRPWVEFYIVDEKNPRPAPPAPTAALPSPVGAAAAVPAQVADDLAPHEPGWWIPVDILRLEEFSSRGLPLEQDWPWFGSSDCFDNIAPLSFHFHPPTTVLNAHPGDPALFGWLALPSTPRMDQGLLFRAGHTPRRAE